MKILTEESPTSFIVELTDEEQAVEAVRQWQTGCAIEDAEGEEQLEFSVRYIAGERFPFAYGDAMTVIAYDWMESLSLGSGAG